MVFITDNEASLHAVNTAVALARPDIDSVHVMHACTNDGSTADAQKLMARLTPGLGPRISSEVMVHRLPNLANADCCVGLLPGPHDHFIAMCLFSIIKLPVYACLPACQMRPFLPRGLSVCPCKCLSVVCMSSCMRVLQL